METEARSLLIYILPRIFLWFFHSQKFSLCANLLLFYFFFCGSCNGQCPYHEGSCVRALLLNILFVHSLLHLSTQQLATKHLLCTRSWQRNQVKPLPSNNDSFTSFFLILHFLLLFHWGGPPVQC